MNSNKINQKEYLKRYFMGDVKKKKKKGKLAPKSTINIVDDDIDLSQLYCAADSEFDNHILGEDLPQIAGIIDERPADLIAKEDYKTNGKWKTIENDDMMIVKNDSRNIDSKLQQSSISVNPSIIKTSSQGRSIDSCHAKRSKHSKYSPDRSPPRRPKSTNKNSNESPPRRSSYRNIDSSDHRHSKHSNQSPDTSPPRRSKHEKRIPDESSKQELNRNIGDARAVSSSPPPTHEKISKTLEGKKVGLQNAKALREENEQFRKRDIEMIADKQKHDNVIFGRKSGRHRHLKEDEHKNREKLQKEKERKLIYNRWGIGLKQIDDYEKQVVSDSHEMNKPIARYANDEDLEEYLRSQCRDGDPMATYFRKKANDLQTGPSKPIYQGSFPENRYNLRPGYRWDGVDRSNGYEKKWFDVLNTKKAIEEDAYKFSVEDM